MRSKRTDDSVITERELESMSWTAKRPLSVCCRPILGSTRDMTGWTGKRRENEWMNILTKAPSPIGRLLLCSPGRRSGGDGGRLAGVGASLVQLCWIAVRLPVATRSESRHVAVAERSWFKGW